MTKKFLLKTLLPYKQNPDLCGYNGTMCVYTTNDNKSCAIGQYMKPGPWQKEAMDVGSLFKKYKEKDIMSEEWCKQRIPKRIQIELQIFHDNIARNYENDYVIRSIENLTGFNLDELK
jgi:hypothetical protein